MIIGACGFGSTGSSAICDYIKEFDNVQVLDLVEFTLPYCVDGLADLEHHIMNPYGRTGDSITAINRFRKLLVESTRKYQKYTGIPKSYLIEEGEKLIHSITTVSWNWYDFNYHSFIEKVIKQFLFQNRIIPYMEKKNGDQVVCYPMKEVNLSIRPKNFQETAKQFIMDLIYKMGGDKNKIIVLDQPFSGNNPQAVFPYFEDPYAIVVDRDPRDNYVFSKTKLLGRNHFMAIRTVEDFIMYYRALREGQPYKNGDRKVLSIKFEDMVYEYDNTTRLIREFLGLQDNPRPRSIFDPSMSIANTQTFRRFPQYEKDIKIIESELKEYLYDFSKYPEPDLTGEMFFGRSPKDK